MKCRTTTWTLLIAAVLAAGLMPCPIALGDEKGADSPGYDDTPFLPNSPCLAKQETRPSMVSSHASFWLA